MRVATLHTSAALARSRPVLLLHSSAGRYGADLQLVAIARGLDRSRWQPVCVLPERGELAALLEEAGAEVLVRPLAVLRRRLLSPRGLAALARAGLRDRRELGALARERGAALVHANTSVVVSAPAVARAAGVPCVVHVREIYAGAASGATARAWPLARAGLERADALACVSRAVAEQFSPRSGAFVLHDGLVRVPEPAPRAAARADLGLPAEAFCVALLGRVSDWKGQDVLARALALPPLAERGAIGLVAGDAFPGEERHERALRALRDELGLGERLRLLGFRDDVDTVLGAADALCVPSTRPDPLPNAALEAAAAGVPVVAAAHGGLPEIVREGETGRLVAPGDPAALAAALAELAADPAEAARLGEAAAADVRGRFSVERMLAELERRYAGLAGG
jgi:glycosyltransferase involved in cell wall biosynthesis